MTFSEQLRAASWDKHEAAAESPFMRRLMAGEIGPLGYAQLVAQHRYIYAVLEDAASVMADDPVAGAFVAPELSRLAALDADLATLLGDRWADQVSASPATKEYCQRLTEVCFTWPGGFVAHHYTRHLGDLSGGQVVGRVLKRVHHRPGNEGIQFYVFDQIEDATAFKARYRRLLDEAPWSPDEQRRVVEEILLAYQLNTRLLHQLS